MNQSAPGYKEYMRKYMLDRYYRRLAEAQARFGSKCNRCGSTRDLQFDHIDRTAKSFGITKYLVSCSQKRFEEEIVKCQLLCATCHKEKTRADFGWVDGNIPYTFNCARCGNQITRFYKDIGPKLKRGQTRFYCNSTCSKNGIKDLEAKLIG